MNSQEIEKKWLVWDYVSTASWSEIGLEGREYIDFAQKIVNIYDNWDEVHKEVRALQCAFAPELFAILMFFPIAPDWGYNEDYLKETIQKWYQKPTWQIWINPFRYLGYPIIKIMTSTSIRRLKKNFEQLTREL